MGHSAAWRAALSAGSAILVLLAAPGAASAWKIQKVINFHANGAAGMLEQPGPLEVDSAGAVLVLSTEGAVVHRRDPDGSVEQVLPENPGEHAFDLTVDGADTVYVPVDDVVHRVTSGGTVDSLSIGGHPLSDLQGHGTGYLLATVVETGTNEPVLFERSPGGTITELLRASDLPGSWLDPALVHRDASGNVYLTLFTTDKVVRITPGGAVTEIIDAAGDGAGNPLYGPADLGFDDAGNVYVAGGLSHNVFRVEPGGSVTEIIDETGDGQGNGLGFAGSLAVAPDGEVFVRGGWSENVFHIATDGRVTELADETVIDSPQDIAFDPVLRALYVSGFDPDWEPLEGGSPDSVYRILDTRNAMPALSPPLLWCLALLLLAVGYRLGARHISSPARRSPSA